MLPVLEEAEGELVGGRFRLEKVAGSGGMGTVWSAQDLLKGERVALKLLHTANDVERRRLLREADALRGVEHPAIVGYVAHGEHRGRGWLAMEWLQGSDLADRLAEGPLSLSELTILARSLAEALAILHEHGLVHRDIKPANIFLQGGDPAKIKIVDFGLAKSLRLEAITAVGQIIGTVAYMAPEQLRLQPLDARTDVFALGCVLWECAVGRRPFDGAPSAIIMKILLESAPRIDQFRPDVGAGFASVVARMMDREPARRPSDARMVVAELADAEGSEPSSQTRISLSGAERSLAALVLATWESEILPRGALAAAQQHRATIEAELAHALVLSFGAGSHADDQIVQATRCALCLSRLPRVRRVAVALVHREPDGIPRAADALGARAEKPIPARTVHIDEAIERLLPERFERSLTPSGWLVLEEHDGLDLPRSVLGRASPFVDRAAELEVVVAATVSADRSRRFGGVIVLGDAGVGKSRLRQEALRRVAEQLPQLSVLVVRGDPALVDSPLGALAACLRRLAHVDGANPSEDRRRLTSRVARHVPAGAVPHVARFLGELVGARSELDDPELRSARTHLPLMGDEMKRAFLTFVAAEAWAGPVLVIVEDEHLVDRASLELLEATARELRASPVSFWLFGRSLPAELAGTRPEPFADFGLARVELGPLPAASARLLVNGLLGDGAAAGRVDAIVEAGRGQPQLIEELCRAQVELRPEVPVALVSLIEARLEELPPHQRRLLSAASLVGQTFWCGALRDLLADSPLPVELTVAELCAKDWLVERSPSRFGGEREYAFRNEPERTAALAHLTAEDRVLGHGIVARWLERVDEPDCSLIAAHFARGGILHVAAVHYAHAVQAALQAGDFQLALEHARRGNSCAPDPSTHAWLALLSAQARRFRGEHELALQAAEEALRTLSDAALGHQDRWFEAAAEGASAAFRVGDLERVEGIAAMLERTTLNTEPRPTQVAMIARVATILLHASRDACALPLLAWLDRVEQRFSTDSILTARISAARGFRAFREGRWLEYRRLSLIGLEGSERAGDRRLAAALRVNAGHASLELGRFEEAHRLLSEALSSAETQSLAPIAALARLYLGPTLARLGRLEEALATVRAAATAFQSEHDARLEGCARIEIGRLLLAFALPREADAEARRAMELLSGLPALMSQAQAMLADAHRASGDLELAVQVARAAVATLEQAGASDVKPAIVHLALAEALARTGAETEAKAALDHASEAVRRLAGAIEDESMRRTFETALPHHIRIVALRVGLGRTLYGEPLVPDPSAD